MKNKAYKIMMILILFLSTFLILSFFLRGNAGLLERIIIGLYKHILIIFLTSLLGVIITIIECVKYVKQDIKTKYKDNLQLMISFLILFVVSGFITFLAYTPMFR